MKLLVESSTIIEYLRNEEVKEVISSAEDFYISP